MNNPTSSSIKNHYLISILPHPFPEIPQITKSRQFYKPEECIWNNTHRTSKQMYKFYHAYNQKYQRQVEPEVKRLEGQDRLEAQKGRILRLIDFRNKTRQNFLTKKKQKEKLPKRLRQVCPSSERNISSFNDFMNTEVNSNENAYGGRSQTFSNNCKPNKGKTSERILRLESSYSKGLKQYDKQRNECINLINEQRDQYRLKIRQQFWKKKDQNSKLQLISASKLKSHTLPSQKIK